MKLIRVLASAGLLVAIGATNARADFKDFSNRCTPGAFAACWSLQVFTTLNGSGGTNVTIMVRNLQGSITADNTGGSLIQRIGLVAPTIHGATGLSVSTISAGVVGSPASSWILRSPGGLGGLIELTAGTTNAQTANGGIAGCDAPYPGFPASYFQTCGGGWVVLSFTTTNAWSAVDARVAVLATNMPGGYGHECDTDDIPTPRPQCYDVTATPEPITMILLGSGLASMGGFGMVRRRRGTDVTNG